jgi:putative transposase
MAVPKRQADPRNIVAPARTFFFTANATEKRHILQSNRLASLLTDVLLKNADQGRFDLHAYVVMPNHTHALFTIHHNMTVERAAQYIKGGFSFRAKKELGYPFDVWQAGYAEERIYTVQHFESVVEYIHMNPVKEGLVSSPELFPHSSAAKSNPCSARPEHLRG